MSLISHGNNSNSIEWQEDGIISLSSEWSLSSASRVGNNSIKINSTGNASTNINFDDMKASNLLVNISVSSSNTDLSTDDTKKVAVQFKFIYDGSEEGQTDIDTKVYYPKFIFESSYRDEPCVISLYDSRQLKEIKVIIYNFENEPIIIENVDIRINYTLQEQINSGIDSKIDGIKDIIDNIKTGKLIIPELTEQIVNGYNNDKSLIPDNSLWWMRSYDYPNTATLTQILDLVKYEETLKKAIDNDICLSSGSYLADTFKNQIVNNTDFRDTLREEINKLDTSDITS